jgi:hypothetical protein
VDRAHLRKHAQRVDEAAGVELLAGRRHELDERLPGAASFAHDEVPKMAALVLLGVGHEPVGARPLADGVADRVAEVRRQPALLDLEHFVPAARFVEAERRPVLQLRERVLELVAVVEDVVRGHDRLERQLRDAADAAQRVGDLRRLRLHLCLVGEILEPTAAAGGVVRARRVDALRARVQHLRRKRLGVTALHLRHARADRVAR